MTKTIGYGTTTLSRSPARVAVPVSPRRSRRGRWDLERAIGWAFVAFVASLPLEWIALTGFAGGLVKPFHLTALVVVGLSVARWGPGRLVLPVMRRHAAIFGAYLLLLGVVGAIGFAHAQPYRDQSDVLRQIFYMSTSVVVAGVFLRFGRRSGQRVLAWVGVVAIPVLLAGLVTTLAAQHINPITLVVEALVKRDPDIISYHLLRSAFRAEEEFAEVGANLRHKVFGALLLAVFAGLAFQPLAEFRRRASRAVLTGAAVVGFGLVLLSLSRAITVCLVGTLLLVPLRAIVRKRSAPRQAGMLALAAVLATALALSPVGSLIYVRFATADSYSGRIFAASSGFMDAFQEAAILGAERSDVEKSPHNVVLDAWLAGGVIAASCALAFLVSYARVWLRELRRYVTGAPGWVLPLSQLWLLGIGLLPLVRAFTSGNQAHMIEWAAVGIFIGSSYANEREARAQTAEPGAPPRRVRSGGFGSVSSGAATNA